MIRSFILRGTSFLMALLISACGGYNNASAQISSLEPVTTEQTSASQSIRIALLLDTSNSMDGLIDQAKSQLWKLVNELSKAQVGTAQPEIHIALYEYGNDRLNVKEGYIRMVTPLTTDLDQVSEDLFALSTNGGSEFCGTVINTSLNQLNWNTFGKDLQLIFIAGNEPFNQGDFNYKEACSKAKEKQVIVNTIYCGNHEDGIRELWYEGAKNTGGNYMNIDQNKQTVFIETPYDLQITELNAKLNDTYVYYGTQGYSKKNNQVTQDVNSNSYGQANATERAISKSKHVYKNESWDLVDASKTTTFSYTKIERSTLPKELQGYSDAQLKAYVEAKAKERATIQAKINELSLLREKYIAEKQKTMVAGETSLDQAMLKAIRAQANAKGMTFVN